MYSGSLHPAYFLQSTPLRSPPFSSTTYPTNRFSPPSPSRTTTTACFTPSCPPSTASISPNSIRYPLIFTCWSFLPIYSNSPPPRYLPTSPPPHNPSPHPPPSSLHLPHYPPRHRFQLLIQHIHLHISDPFPDPAPHPSPPLHLLLLHLPIRHMHRGLRDPVHVHHPHPLPISLLPLLQLPPRHRLPSQDHHPHLQPSPFPSPPSLPFPHSPLLLHGLHHPLKSRRRLIQYRHPLLLHHLHMLLSRPAHLIRHHHQPPPIQQRSPHLPYRKIKGIRVEQRPHILRPKPIP